MRYENSQKKSKKNQLLKKNSRLSKLRLNDFVATSFDEKIQMFKKSFFLNGDLNDINNFTYAKSLILTKSIEKQNE